MREKSDDSSATHTLQEWAAVAEQAADKAKREFRQPRSPERFQAVWMVGILVLGIAYALGPLLFPQLFAAQPPRGNA